MKRTSAYVFPMLIALYYPFCAPRVQPTMPPWNAPLAELWQRPGDIASRDLFYGPWGKERAPDPGATYTFSERKQHGTNPGVTVLTCTQPSPRLAPNCALFDPYHVASKAVWLSSVVATT